MKKLVRFLRPFLLPGIGIAIIFYLWPPEIAIMMAMLIPSYLFIRKYGR